MQRQAGSRSCSYCSVPRASLCNPDKSGLAELTGCCQCPFCSEYIFVHFNLGKGWHTSNLVRQSVKWKTDHAYHTLYMFPIWFMSVHMRLSTQIRASTNTDKYFQINRRLKILKMSESIYHLVRHWIKCHILILGWSKGCLGDYFLDSGSVRHKPCVYQTSPCWKAFWNISSRLEFLILPWLKQSSCWTTRWTVWFLLPHPVICRILDVDRTWGVMFQEPKSKVKLFGDQVLWSLLSQLERERGGKAVQKSIQFISSCALSSEFSLLANSLCLPWFIYKQLWAQYYIASQDSFKNGVRSHAAHSCCSELAVA